MKKIHSYIQSILMRSRYLSECESAKSLRSKVAIQLLTASAFLALSIANICVKSYIMLAATLFGFLAYAVLPIISIKTNSIKLCNYSSIIVCAVVFSVFVIVGGNDGFACLWIALLPIFAMVTMDFTFGLIVSIVLQVFLFVVFWTPINKLLLYQYNEQFCLRFPLYYSISMLLGMVTTISLQNSRYNERMYLSELENLTEIEKKMARSDSLTGLANRRYAYELFNKDFSDENIPHSIAMGDIDGFKKINDTFDHGFGDEVLVAVANYITELLPESYIKARWGGEEFLIAANEPLGSFFEKLEMLRQKISEHDFCY